MAKAKAVKKSPKNKVIGTGRMIKKNSPKPKKKSDRYA